MAAEYQRCLCEGDVWSLSRERFAEGRETRDSLQVFTYLVFRSVLRPISMSPPSISKPVEAKDAQVEQHSPSL